MNSDSDLVKTLNNSFTVTTVFCIESSLDFTQ